MFRLTAEPVFPPFYVIRFVATFSTKWHPGIRLKEVFPGIDFVLKLRHRLLYRGYFFSILHNSTAKRMTRLRLSHYEDDLEYHFSWSKQVKRSNHGPQKCTISSNYKYFCYEVFFFFSNKNILVKKQKVYQVKILQHHYPFK